MSRLRYERQTCERKEKKVQPLDFQETVFWNESNRWVAVQLFKVVDTATHRFDSFSKQERKSKAPIHTRLRNGCIIYPVMVLGTLTTDNNNNKVYPDSVQRSNAETKSILRISLQMKIGKNEKKSIKLTVTAIYNLKFPVLRSIGFFERYTYLWRWLFFISTIPAQSVCADVLITMSDERSHGWTPECLLCSTVHTEFKNNEKGRSGERYDYDCSL